MSTAVIVALAIAGVIAASVVMWVILDLRFRAAFEHWKAEHVAYVSREAIRGSESAITGRVIEKVAPYLPGFAWNPRDARFIGDPVDFVVFDGLAEGELRRIVFVEVKSGGGTLNGNERKVKAAVTARQVEWELFTLKRAPE